MKEKFCLLKVLEGTPLQLAFVRSLLSGMVYIEIDNCFIISCAKSFKESFSKSLTDKQIIFILIYVNLKPGCDVLTNGINNNDEENIKKIVLDI